MLGAFCGMLTHVSAEGRLDLPASVVTIGAFDGVHLGHQALIRRTVAEARVLGVPSLVWTFDPPPKVVFAGAGQLSTLDDKLARIGLFGPDHIVVASFTPAYRRLSAADFLAGLARVSPVRVLVGADFRFGAGQAGDIGLLGQHFAVSVVDPVRCAAQQVVSSSRIRSLRAKGAHDLAKHIHGCPGPAALLAGRMVLDQSQLCEDPYG